ncbi:MAG: hypothetical protein ABEI86_14630 [Halobacteriaceae archaeon]
MNKKELLDVAPLFKGRIQDRRTEIYDNIVRLYLSNLESGDPISVSRIQTGINEQYSIELSSTDIVSSLQTLSEAGTVTHISDREYRLNEVPHVDSFDEQFEPVWDEFKQILQNQPRDVDPQFINKGSKRAFEEFIYIFFKNLSDSADEIENINTDTLLVEDYEEIINKVIRVNNLKEENAFKSALIEYLSEPGEELIDFTDSFYTGIINFNLLSKEEDIPFRELPTSGKKIFLDTNVIVGLLCKSDDLHPLIVEVCERSNSLGFAIHYSQHTVEELNTFISGSKHEMEELGTLPDTEMVNSQLVRDYVNSDDWESWKDYIQYIENWKDILELNWGITEYQDGGVEDNIEEFTRKSIRTFERNQNVPDEQKKSTDAVQHDSRLLGTVANLRDEEDTESIGPYILSFDSTINSLSSIGDGTFWDREVVMQPRSWLNYILTFTSADIDERDTRSAVRAVLESATQFEDDLTIDQYVKLLVPKMGLDAEKEEIVRRYIIDSPLENELSGALEKGDLQRAKETTKKIFTDDDWLETFKDIHDKTEQLRHAQETVAEFQERYKQEKEEKEKFKQALNSQDNLIDLSELLAGENADPDALASLSNEVNDFASLLATQIENDWNHSELPRPPEEPESMDEVQNWVDDICRVLTSPNDLPPAVNSLEEFAIQLNEKIER